MWRTAREDWREEAGVEVAAGGVTARAADGEFQRVSLGVREMKCELGEWRGKRCSAE